MHERVALLAPTYNPRQMERCFLRNLDGRPPTAIAAGALTLLPGPARLLIEHDPDRPAGYMRSLFRMPWTDGQTWHAALLELDDDGWPDNQPVSIGYASLRETTLVDRRRILERALVDEISLVNQPAIAGARLLPAPAPSETPVASTRPRTLYTTPDLRAAQNEAAKRGRLIRNCGQILRVR